MSTKTVLLIEDNEDDVELTRRTFERHHLPVQLVVARNGEEALACLADATQKPALILLDLKLPKVSGLKVLERIRAEQSTRRIPVVVLTTSDEQKDKLESYNLGANSYVRKPVDFDQFVTAARQLGEYWLTLNETPPEEPHDPT